MHNNDPHAPHDAQGENPDVEASNLEIETLKLQLSEQQALNAELREANLREHAELDNQRRRMQRDLDQARRFANEKLLNELLPVYDGLERGLAVETGDVASVREGISLTLKSLLKIAESNGLVQIDPLGQALDPERHHAVSMVDAPGAMPNTVVNVLQKGYVLNDRLLRPALVAVAKSD